MKNLLTLWKTVVIYGMHKIPLMNRLRWRTRCLNSSENWRDRRIRDWIRFLNVFCDEVVVAFFWKRLLKTASQFPKVFAQHLFELCVADPIQRYPETFYELGLFLEAAASEFTSDQLHQIEKTILTYPIETTDENQGNLLKRERNRLLSRIPENLLTTDEGKQIREKMARENDVPENRPLVSFGPATWSEYTEEEDLQDQGVDTTTLEESRITKFF